MKTLWKLGNANNSLSVESNNAMAASSSQAAGRVPSARQSPEWRLDPAQELLEPGLAACFLSDDLDAGLGDQLKAA